MRSSAVEDGSYVGFRGRDAGSVKEKEQGDTDEED